MEPQDSFSIGNLSRTKPRAQKSIRTSAPPRMWR